MTRSTQALEARGFTVSFGRNAHEETHDFYPAGTPAQRGADLMEAFLDPGVDAIIAANAGIGSRDVLPHLDAAAIARSPKPFIGYCDNIFLHQFLASEAGISSVYGCTFMQHFGEAGEPFPETFQEFEQVLMEQGPISRLPYPSRTRDWVSWLEADRDAERRVRGDTSTWTWLRAGAGTGPLVGAEIALLPEVVETFDLDLDGVVLFWDVSPANEAPLPEQFDSLTKRCDLGGLAAMMIGVTEWMSADQWVDTVRETIADFASEVEYPIVVNADLGHLAPGWIIPYGETACLDPENGLVFPRAGEPALGKR